MKRKVPRLRSDAEAEAFLDQDLSDLDFAQFKPAHFEFAKKSARVNMRFPDAMLKSVKESASRNGVPYQRFIREAVAEKLARRK